MPLQNRGAPDGEIVATPARGTLMGNRGGQLHDAQRRLGARRWTKPAWIACRLVFNDRRRQVMAPRQYTELFFLDEMTALAAGHRPCGECRRPDLNRFRQAWLGGGASVVDIDTALHAARVEPRTRAKRVLRAPLGGLPVGAMVQIAGRSERAFLRLDAGVRPWSFGGYGALEPLEDRLEAVVLTPAPILEVLRRGYRPGVHASAGLETAS